MENGRTFKTVIQLFEQVFHRTSAGNGKPRGQFGQRYENEGPFVHTRVGKDEVRVFPVRFLPEEQKVHVDDAGAEAVVRIAYPAQFGFLGQHGVEEVQGRHALFAVEPEHLIQEPGLVGAALRFRLVEGGSPGKAHTGYAGDSRAGLPKVLFRIPHVGADAYESLCHVRVLRG